ncbi:hypothetical protein [Ornithinimicrobium kibberense]|uniref:hypothetical protein n=1 Tax=Ornithinimicrobium kibberense TaxID=282060 RepID=UPI00360BD0FF
MAPCRTAARPATIQGEAWVSRSGSRLSRVQRARSTAMAHEAPSVSTHRARTISSRPDRGSIGCSWDTTHYPSAT